MFSLEGYRFYGDIGNDNGRSKVPMQSLSGPEWEKPETHPTNAGRGIPVVRLGTTIGWESLKPAARTRHVAAHFRPSSQPSTTTVALPDPAAAMEGLAYCISSFVRPTNNAHSPIHPLAHLPSSPRSWQASVSSSRSRAHACQLQDIMR